MIEIRDYRNSDCVALASRSLRTRHGDVLPYSSPVIEISGVCAHCQQHEPPA